MTLVFLGAFGTFFAHSKSLLEYEEPMAFCIGDIVFNTEIDPDLCLYYKGNKLQLDMHYDKKSKRLGDIISKKELLKIVPYTLTEAKATQQFHILICSQPRLASDSNTVMYLHVPNNVDYKFYSLSAARKYNEDGDVIGCTWTIEEEHLMQDGIVPDNTIVFLFNANYIEGLEAKSWPVNSNIRLIPSIVMKKTIQREDIAQAIVEARMLAIDFDTVHRHNIQNATKIEKKTVVTIKTQSSCV